jgi:CHAT domain-containing protein
VNNVQVLDRNYCSPVIVHIALHGFVREHSDGNVPQFDETVQMSVIQEALRRSGLAFSGACASAEALESRDPLPASLPGILSAYEISGLDLRETQLVVLAACDTGLGTLSSGEGIFGLQRSFFVAGAHSLIMTLWSVTESVTGKLIEAFYSGLCRGESRSQALRNAQLQIRTWFKHPAFWAGFICQGNPLPIAQVVRQGLEPKASSANQ